MGSPIFTITSGCFALLVLSRISKLPNPPSQPPIWVQGSSIIKPRNLLHFLQIAFSGTLGRHLFNGARTLEARDGAQAFEIVKQKGPVDVVVTDVRMPGGDGVALLKNIRGLGGVGPVVILASGFVDIKRGRALCPGGECRFSKTLR